MDSFQCPFCELPPSDIVWRSDLVVAIRDRYPVSKGHTLVISRAHHETYFAANPWEQAEIWRAVKEVKVMLDKEFAPSGYDVGFSSRATADQTTTHLHVHVIPCYEDGAPYPRPSIRSLVPMNKEFMIDSSAIERIERTVEDSSGTFLANPFANLAGFVFGEDMHFGPVLAHAIQCSDDIDIVAAFVQQSGLNLIREDLRQAMERGARVRFLTGDYMNTTNHHALRALLSLQSEFPDQFVPYFFAGGGNRSFHPKAYIFVRGDQGVAFVGSSNLSHTALTSGIEWNLRTVTSTNQEEFDAIRARYEALLTSPYVRLLTREVIDTYSKRAPVPSGPEPRIQAFPPHSIQVEALNALRESREDGAKAGLVVMATGLGKTYLSALDCKNLGAERALFVAHREEILTQARDSWERVFPEKVTGLLVGDQYEPEVDCLFASVQTLSRNSHLEQFPRNHFDYIVIDEIHHGAARTYRKVAGYFEPKFLLGLTATPDRMDGQSILDLCHDNLVYRAGLAQGIDRDLLVPFRYFGIRDEVDFATIPWRGRWPIEELTRHVATRSRAEQTLREYGKHAPSGLRRTLAFCCSIHHADFMADFFREQGISAVAVHSGPHSAPRANSLERLRSGQLEIICTVDVFNEGLDIPDINVVLMLRPTESPVIFLQQLGRGLRKPLESHKNFLTIVDFIGNHRSFLIKPQALLALVGQKLGAGVSLDAIRRDKLELPNGCDVNIETEVIDMLYRIARLSKDDMLIYEYTALRDSHGRRPTAAEVYASGIAVNKPIRDRYGTWFDFVASQDDLTEQESALLDLHRDWFDDLHRSQMKRSYKMVTLRAMLEGYGLSTGMMIPELARRSSKILNSDFILRQELAELQLSESREKHLEQFWRDQPVKDWIQGQSTARTWFAVKDEKFHFLGKVEPSHMPLFEDLTSELVELRLAEHRDRLRSKSTDPIAPIRIRVSHSGGSPILRFDRRQQPAIPEAGSEVIVLVDDESYLFRFQKIAVNVARQQESSSNVLSTLMRQWFGPSAGLPGTHHYVMLSKRSNGWVLKPDLADQVSLEVRILDYADVSYFPDVKVACGELIQSAPNNERFERMQVRASIPVDLKQHFVVQASGNSMTRPNDQESTGVKPEISIEDGDFVLCEWLEATSVEQVENSICLLAGVRNGQHRVAGLKVPVRHHDTWLLRSLNPEVVDTRVPRGTVIRPVARALEVVESVPKPNLWAAYDREAVTQLFGVKNDRSWQVGHRDLNVSGAGHSVLFVTLRKDENTPAEQRYADRFLSEKEFQWESQAATKPSDKKARNILEQATNGQVIHLFCRYRSKQKSKTVEFTYCGTIRYRRHQGSKPIRIWFNLDYALPTELLRQWDQ